MIQENTVAHRSKLLTLLTFETVCKVYNNISIRIITIITYKSQGDYIVGLRQINDKM